jgi:ribose 5-phosphate isomerase B
MNIYIAADHGGLDLCDFLVDSLEHKGFSVHNTTAGQSDPTDDYPTMTKDAIQKVQNDPSSRGILICRNGVGVTIFANRFKGIRAGLSWNPDHAASHRLDDNTNILTLPADYISKEDALKIALTWLETDFSQDERHKRRIKLIEELA